MRYIEREKLFVEDRNRLQQTPNKNELVCCRRGFDCRRARRWRELVTKFDVSRARFSVSPAVLLLHLRPFYGRSGLSSNRGSDSRFRSLFVVLRSRLQFHAWCCRVRSHPTGFRETKTKRQDCIRRNEVAHTYTHQVGVHNSVHFCTELCSKTDGQSERTFYKTRTDNQAFFGACGHKACSDCKRTVEPE